MNHVLIIDGDLQTCKEIKYNLQDDSTDVYYTQSTDQAIQMMRNGSYSLVIMDVCLSQNGGTALIRQLRQMDAQPILVLSETASTADKVVALKCGADDFLDKPYELEECLARAQALMRRYTQLNPITGRNYALVCHGNLMLDVARHRACVNGKNVALTRKEYAILLYFLKNRNQVLSFEQIHQAVWRDNYLSDNSAIFYHVRNLRRKLEADWIQSTHGVGFFICNPN